jgi:hypothetical protein
VGCGLGIVCLGLEFNWVLCVLSGCDANLSFWYGVFSLKFKFGGFTGLCWCYRGENATGFWMFRLNSSVLVEFFC